MRKKVIGCEKFSTVKSVRWMSRRAVRAESTSRFAFDRNMGGEPLLGIGEKPDFMRFL
jgi:hypothetical protein